MHASRISLSIVSLTTTIVASLVATSACSAEYSQVLSMVDQFMINPFEMSNAEIYQDDFAPNVRYWGPTTPNVDGFVTLKFDVPFAIQNASVIAGVTAYTVGSDANFDSNAATYLDVSTDNSTWTTVASQTNTNAVGSGISGPWDLSSLVSGSNVVYVRARMFMTTDDWFSPAQFMRQGSPYAGGLFSASAIDPPLNKFSTLLDFNAPVANTITDVHGLGTGFTDRLPGTGGAIPRDDPNLNLQSMPGYLAFQSQRADINQFNGFGRNLSNLDAPGVSLTNMIDRDFRITAKFDDVSVPGLSDQLLLYVGTNAENVLRGGFHEAGSPSVGQYVLAGNTGAGDFGFPGIGVPGSFAAGDDIVLSLSRIDGQWSLEWDNLTNSAASGSFTGASVPWLDGEDTLYVGLMHMDARNTTSQIAKIDYFCVEVEPVAEPSCGILAVTALIGTRALCRRPTTAGA